MPWKIAVDLFSKGDHPPRPPRQPVKRPDSLCLFSSLISQCKDSGPLPLSWCLCWPAFSPIFWTAEFSSLQCSLFIGPTLRSFLLLTKPGFQKMASGPTSRVMLLESAGPQSTALHLVTGAGSQEAYRRLTSQSPGLSGTGPQAPHLQSRELYVGRGQMQWVHTSYQQSLRKRNKRSDMAETSLE